jgi:hypothetical protein
VHLLLHTALDTPDTVGKQLQVPRAVGWVNDQVTQQLAGITLLVSHKHEAVCCDVGASATGKAEQRLPIAVKGVNAVPAAVQAFTPGCKDGALAG